MPATRTEPRRKEDATRKIIGVPVTPEQFKRIEKYAVDEGRTVANMVRRMIEDWMEQHPAHAA